MAKENNSCSYLLSFPFWNVKERIQNTLARSQTFSLQIKLVNSRTHSLLSNSYYISPCASSSSSFIISAQYKLLHTQQNSPTFRILFSVRYSLINGGKGRQGHRHRPRHHLQLRRRVAKRPR